MLQASVKSPGNPKEKAAAFFKGAAFAIFI
jgi:hypothetical protein